jgi:hypothetical protein
LVATFCSLSILFFAASTFKILVPQVQRCLSAMAKLEKQFGRIDSVPRLMSSAAASASSHCPFSLCIDVPPPSSEAIPFDSIIQSATSAYSSSSAAAAAASRIVFAILLSIKIPPGEFQTHRVVSLPSRETVLILNVRT